MVQDPDPGFTAAEIATAFDKTRQWADQRLKQLAEKGFVNSKNPGGNARFWWVTEAGREHLRETRDQ